MALENRSGRKYFYRPIRLGKRVVKLYIGGGVVGEMAAALQAEKSRKRQEERDRELGILKELQAIDSWRQREFVEAGGWATSSGDKSPNSNVASACAEQLVKAKT